MGTIGYGVFRSENDGKGWDRFNFTIGLPCGIRVQDLVPHPRTPEAVFAGTDYGLARSDDAGRQWQILDNPLWPYAVSAFIQTVAVHEADPNLIYGNSLFGSVYRSDDVGDSWGKLRRELSERLSLIWSLS